MAIANQFEEITVRVNPPSSPIKLVFVHHSVGGLWLAHDNGGLVSELNKNNYYVNDVTYGWEPDKLTDSAGKKIIRFSEKVVRKVKNKAGISAVEIGARGIGNRTDIGHMYDWFLGEESELILSALYGENLETTRFGDHSNKTSAHPLDNPDPTTENQVIMYKSCYPNTMLRGGPYDKSSSADPPFVNFSVASDQHTVANAKRVFNDLLSYFSRNPDKFFVIATPPPLIKSRDSGTNARAFSNWLVNDWLADNNYPIDNVFVFDFFNVLTSGYSPKKSDIGEKQGNHHRVWGGKIQHIVEQDNNTLVYPRKDGDNHPSAAGLQKATNEFVPLLNYYMNQWQARR